jgi:hypothetical protein
LFQGLHNGVYLSGAAGTLSRIEVGQNKYHNVTNKMVNGFGLDTSPTSGSFLQLISNPGGFAPTTQSDSGYLFLQNGVLKFKDTAGVTKTVVLQ